MIVSYSVVREQWGNWVKTRRQEKNQCIEGSWSIRASVLQAWNCDSVLAHSWSLCPTSVLSKLSYGLSLWNCHVLKFNHTSWLLVLKAVLGQPGRSSTIRVMPVNPARKVFLIVSWVTGIMKRHPHWKERYRGRPDFEGFNRGSLLFLLNSTCSWSKGGQCRLCTSTTCISSLLCGIW